MTTQELIKHLNFSSPQRFKYNFYFSTIGYYDSSDIDRHIKAKFFDTFMDCIKIDEPFVAVLRHLGTEDSNFSDTKHVMCELDFSNLQDYIEKLEKEMIAENGKAARYISQLETQLATVTAERDKAVENLKNAVILPCKVGDTVYVYNEDKKEILGYRIISVILYDGVPTLYSAEYRENNGKFYIKDFTEFNIGKTVFLTREEAKQALKERTDNNG